MPSTPPPTIGTGTGKGSRTSTSSGNPNGSTPFTNPYFEQPKFDARISTINIPGGNQYGPFRRGYMIWDKPMPGYGSNRARVHFLYNPSTVAGSFSLDPNSEVTSAMRYKNPYDTATPSVPMTQNISFSLLFDRTFETWGSYGLDQMPKDQTQDPINDPAASGVGVDILAMEQFTGMLMYQNQGTGNKPAGPPQPGIDFHQQGIMLPIFSWLYFGTPTSLVYYGFIDSWDLTVTHWTQFMVPTRCAIDVSFTLMPPPPGEPRIGTGADSFWSLIGVGSASPPPFIHGTANSGPGGRGGR